jgi:exopolyphosphatase/guanosine-5'-triphosphate,3'-diphosphate pyrophosphatase
MLTIAFGPRDIVFTSDDGTYKVPVGVDTLAAMISGDPPFPEDLINAIGLVMDHIEDVIREVPSAAWEDHIECTGVGLGTIAAVEIGGSATHPFELTREAAEEVFRTVATEAAVDRARNPGLPAAEVHQVLGASCAVVAVLRALHAPMVILNK